MATATTAIPRPASRASRSRSALRGGLAEGERDKEYDRFTKLYHYRAREYDPNTGRFLQEDPIWFNAGDKNLYRYVWNSPTKYTDPSGKSAAIEYACELVASAAEGIDAGTKVGVGLAGDFTYININYANAIGDADAANQALITGAKSAATLLAIAESWRIAGVVHAELGMRTK